MSMPAPPTSIWVTLLTVLIGIAVLCVLLFPYFGPRLPWEPDNRGLLVRLKKRRERLLRAIKDAEFERESGALAEAEYRALRNELKLKAVTVTRELEQARVMRLKALGSRGRGLPTSQRKHLEDLVAKRVAALTTAPGAKGA